MIKKILVLLLCLPMLGMSYSHSPKVISDSYSPQRTTTDLGRFCSSYNNGLTFAKDFRKNAGGELDAYALGLGQFSFTASRDATHPATYIDANGVVQLVTSSDTPRFSSGYYDATGFHSQKGLMIEAAGTNLFVNGAFDVNSNWVDGVSDDVLNYGADNRWSLYVNTPAAITANTISTDSKYSRSAQIDITTDGAAASDIQFFGVNLLSLANATTYTVSFWVKATAAKTIPFIIQERNDDYTTYNDLGTFDTVANTWVRITKSFTGLTGGADVTDAALNILLGNIGTFTINIEGLQIEANPYATSFIPTTTAALTRNAEVLKYATSGNRTAAQETVLVKLAPEWQDNTKGNYSNIILYTDTKVRTFFSGWGIDGPYLQPNETDSATCKPPADGGHVGSFILNTSTVLGAVCQHSSPYGTVYKDGSILGTSETVDDYINPAWGTYFYVGSDSGGATQFNGYIQSIEIWNRPLSASEIASESARMAAN